MMRRSSILMAATIPIRLTMVTYATEDGRRVQTRLARDDTGAVAIRGYVIWGRAARQAWLGRAMARYTTKQDNRPVTRRPVHTRRHGRGVLDE